MTSLRIQVKFALVYFLIAAVLGIALRSFPVVDVGVNYRFIVNTHSHIALLGWVYLAISTLLYYSFFDELIPRRSYQRLFWTTQITLIGMLLTFPFMGYAPLSIVFSTGFLFVSYWFAWFFMKFTPQELKSTQGYRWVQLALWFMVISSLGPWALGIIMNTAGSESVWYRLAIYFYLHFQYNGWMTLALLGLLFFIFERSDLTISDFQFKWIIVLFLAGVVLSFFLSTLWTKPSMVYYLLGGMGALCQMVAYAWLVGCCWSQKRKLTSLLTKKQLDLLITVAVLLTVKFLLQLLTAFPYFTELAATVMDFTIGYIHWTFLGVITIGIFLFLDYFQVQTISKSGFGIYLAGFILTEGLIFYKGLVLWQSWVLFQGYFHLLVLVSLLIPVGLIIILFSKIEQKTRVG